MGCDKLPSRERPRTTVVDGHSLYEFLHNHVDGLADILECFLASLTPSLAPRPLAV
jgi:hypothetical protein